MGFLLVAILSYVLQDKKVMIDDLDDPMIKMGYRIDR